MKSYIVIDVETTGLYPSQDDIIEIAALRVVDGVPVREFSRLVCIDRPLSTEIVRLTGITNEDLQTSGLPLAQAMEDLQDFIGTLPLVGHNTAFDQQFLTAACSKVGCELISNRFIDTLSIARRKISGVSNYRLETLAAHFGFASNHHHRALADCHTTHCLFAKLNEI